MTGYRFTLALMEPSLGPLSTELVELDGVPSIGHRLRVKRADREADPWITGVTWFRARGALSPSDQLILSGNRP